MFLSLFKKIFKFFKAILMALNSILNEKEKEDSSEEENVIFENDENNKEEEKEQEEVIFNTNTGANGLDLNIEIVNSSFVLRENLIPITAYSGSFTKDGITINCDPNTGVVVLNGTATAGTTFNLTSTDNYLLPGQYYLEGGQYSYSDPQQGGVGYEYYLEATVSQYRSGMWIVDTSAIDTGNGAILEVNSWVNPQFRNRVRLIIYVGVGQTLHNLCFTPYIGKTPRQANINDIIIYQDPYTQTPAVGTEIPNVQIVSELNTLPKGYAFSEFELENNTCWIQNGRTSGEVTSANYYPTLKVGSNVIDCYPLGVYLYDASGEVFEKYRSYIFTGAQWIQISSAPV